MTADWAIGQPNDHDLVLLSQPFDPSSLSLVAEGANEFGTWELHDGPHPRIEDPRAVGERLIIRGCTGNVTDTGGVGPALSPDQTAVVGAFVDGIGSRRHGFILARCNAHVVSGRVSFDDGTSEDVVAAISDTTGQHWLICAVGSNRTPTGIHFCDAAGNILDSQDISNPPAPSGRRDVT